MSSVNIMSDAYRDRFTAKAVPYGGVCPQAVLRVVPVPRVRPPVGRQGIRQQEPAGPHAEHGAGHHLPGTHVH